MRSAGKNGVSIYIHWAPFLFGTSVCCFPCYLYFFEFCRMNSLNFLVSATIVYPHSEPNRRLVSFAKGKSKSYSVIYPSGICNKLRVTALKKEPSESQESRNVADDEGTNKVLLRQNSTNSSDPGWFPAFPHVLVASMSNFIFGYHIGSVSLKFLFSF